MGRAGRVVVATTTVLLLGAGGYAAADAYDVVPGVLTLEPAPSPPPPFPTAPGAVPGPDPAPAVPVLDAGAPLPAADQVVAAARALVADPRMGTSVGVVVTDVLTGDVLADVDGATPRTPASTAKVLTALAAMTAIGPERTLPTTVVRGGPGELVLVGGGDMLLSAGPGDPDAVNGRAGLVDLAAQVAGELRGDGTTDVRLVVDDGLLAGPAIAPGWDPADVAIGYVAPVASLAVNVAKTREAPYPPRHADPALHAAETFAGLLREQGFTVAPPVRGTAPDDATELGRVESAPLGDVVRYAMQLSENTITEVLCHLVAVERGEPATFASATAAVLDEVAEVGLDTTGAVLSDCSGLARGSALPAELLTDVLQLSADPTRTELLAVASDLPVSGWQGTMADRLTADAARGVVRAKTGSLAGVTSLAGTVQTRDGRLLAFAVLADATPPGGQPGPRAAIDSFVAGLAACGCSA